MIKRSKYWLVPFFIMMLGCTAQYKIHGTFQIEHGTNGIFPGYQNILSKFSRISFYKDSVFINSGIYYYLIDQDQDSLTLDKFPFVFAGKSTVYKCSNDSIQFYFKPFDRWLKYGLAMRKDDLHLVSEFDTLVLRPVNEIIVKKQTREIASIEARIEMYGSFQYIVAYALQLFPNDSLRYRDVDHPKGLSFKMNQGTFEKIKTEFDYVDLLNLKDEYLSEESDEIEIKLTVVLKDGKILKTKINGLESVPAELMSPVVSIIFSHQEIMYGEIPPVNQPFLNLH